MKRRTRVLVTAVPMTVLVVVAAGLLYWAAHHERWKADEVLADACDGILVHDQARAYLGDGPLRSVDPQIDEGSPTDSRRPWDLRCEVDRDVEFNQGKPAHTASLEVRIHSGPFRDMPGGDRGHSTSVRGDYPPVPLGRGWKGTFNANGPDHTPTRAEGSTSLLLTCSTGRPDLLVTVRTNEDDADYDNPHTRLAHARLATATAAQANEKWGCGAHLGKSLRTVGLPAIDAEGKPLGDASGTCAGLPGRRGTVTHAWESSRDGGPLEACVVGDGRMHEMEGRKELVNPSHYELTAYYGAYGKEQRALERHSAPNGSRLGKDPAGTLFHGGHWRSASCPDDDGPAFFTIGRRGQASSPSPKRSRTEAAYQRAALDAFAKRSAQAHGCTLGK